MVSAHIPPTRFDILMINTIKLALIIMGAFAPFYLCLAEENDSRHWDYGGTWNPTRWSELKPEYALCQHRNRI